MPPEGQSIVGISLTPAQVPALQMHGGDKVRIIVTPAANGDAPTGTPEFTEAEVVVTAITKPQETPLSTSWCPTPTRACSPPVPRPATSR